MVVLSWCGNRDRGVTLAVSLLVAALSYRFVVVRFRRRRHGRISASPGLDPGKSPSAASVLS
jgi:hypothetical protein